MNDEQETKSDGSLERINLLYTVFSSEGQEINGNIIPFSKYFSLYPKIKRMSGGIIHHYLNNDSFESILLGKQIRLTRFDKMYDGHDEGKHIFILFSECIQYLYKKKKIDQVQKNRLEQSIEEMSGVIVQRYLRDTKEITDCIPYVMCFTTNRYEDGSTPDFIMSRDLYLFFHVSDMELNIIDNPDGIKDKSDDCYNSVEISKVEYSDSFTKGVLSSFILDCIKKANGRLDLAVDLIKVRINMMRLTQLPSKYKNEREHRLIVYVPVELEKHPKISKYLVKKRIVVGEQSLDIESNVEDYIYLNFSSNKKYIWVAKKKSSMYNRMYYEYKINSVRYIPIIEEHPL